MEQGNGTLAAYTYDNAGRAKTISNRLANGNLLSSFSYDYDANGNRTRQVETQNGFLSAHSLTTDYTYDSLDRLTGYTESDGTSTTTHSFTYYPSYDRRTQQVERDGVALKNRTYQYDETYWLTGITETANSGGSITYQYDNNGNTTRKTDTTGTTSQSTLFSYNSRNQLVQVAGGVPNQEITLGRHAYNYAGMRTRHLDSERGDIEYLYDGTSVIDELRNNTSQQIAHYRYGDRLLSLRTNGTDQFYHYAGLGTTANLTNANGENQVAYRTDPYGEITQQEGESVNRHVFTGQEHDERTDLIYFGARFYDPDTARFINQDTYLGEGTTPPSLHRYLYAYANPTYYVDPDGHCPVALDMATCSQMKADMLGLDISTFEGVNALGSYERGEIIGGGKAVADTVTGIADLVWDFAGSAAHSVSGGRVATEESQRLGERVAGLVEFAKDPLGTIVSGMDASMEAHRQAMESGDYRLAGEMSGRRSMNISMTLAGGAYGGTSMTVLRSTRLSQLETKPSLTGERSNLNNETGRGRVDQETSVATQASGNSPVGNFSRSVAADARFLKDSGITDPALRRQIVESGFRSDLLGADTPITNARFDKLFNQTVAQGKAFQGRLGNIDTRVSTINKAAEFERRGLIPRFEFPVNVDGSKRFVDLVGLNSQTRQPVNFVQLVKENRAGAVIRRDEIIAAQQIERSLNLPPSTVQLINTNR